MDEFLKEIMRTGNVSFTFTITEAIAAIVLSYLLVLLICIVYRKTHTGISYSQSFIHTMLLMGTVISLIMLIIGSNLARAFSLVGALSIVRFRSAVKDSKDVAYIFFCMAIGMACGTRFYMLGIISCLIICCIMLTNYYLDFGKLKITHHILKVCFPIDVKVDNILEDILKKYAEDYKLVSIETVKNGLMNELTWMVNLKDKINYHTLIENIKAKNDNNNILLLSGDKKVEI